MLNLNELNNKQLEAVTNDIHKHLLVIAGAGTGKTKVLVSRYAFLLQQHFSSERIMAITFTKKAAEEMQRRISKITGNNLHYYNSWIANFHRIANKILRDNYTAAKFTTENFKLIDKNEQKTLLKNEILNNENLLGKDLVNFIKLCNETENEREKRLQNFYDNVVDAEVINNNQPLNLISNEKSQNNVNNINTNIKFEVSNIKNLTNVDSQQITQFQQIVTENNIKNTENLYLEIDTSTADAFKIKQILYDINYFKELGIRADDYWLLVNNQYVETTAEQQFSIEFLSEYSNLIQQFNACEINEDKNNINKLNFLKLELFFKGNNKLNMQYIFDTQERKKCYENFYIIYKTYETYCLKNDIVDFSESLLRCYELLRENRDLLKKYQLQFKHILIDEFQDTNQLQYRWLSLLHNNENYFFAVGDDDQSIYKFRGAKVINIALYRYYFSADNITKLSQNYRSTKNILNAANAVISNNKYRVIQKNLWTTAIAGNKLTEYSFYDANDEAAFVVNDIKNKVKNQQNKYIDFTILYRNNSFSQNLEKLLLKNNIPYQVVGGFKFYEREEIKNALAYMQLMLNPNDNIAFQRVINIPKRRNGNAVIKKIKNIAMQDSVSYFEAANKLLLSNKKDKGIAEFVDIIQVLHNKLIELQNLVQDNRLANLYYMLLEKAQLVNYYANNQNLNKLKEEEKSKVDNLFELQKAVTNFELEPENINKNLVELLRDYLDYVLIDAVNSEKVGENEKDKVLLMTVHKAKGLEFNNVYLIGMESGSFPNSYYDINSLDFEEERRLMYVAITRAKQNLVLSYVKNERLVYNKYNGANIIKERSIFLKEIPEEFIERIDLSDRSFYCN